MGRSLRPGSPLAPRWYARLALAAGAAAVLVLLLSAGLTSIALVAVGLAGLAATAAGAWWALAHRALPRALGLALAVAAPLVVVALYVLSGMLWVVVASLALGALAVSSGWAALAADTGRTGATARPAAAPKRPFLIMNPRSGGGKVGRFHLVEKAQALGADIVLLDAAHPVDVADLARRAADEGADLLGVAGGDGTQALVAGVAAERGLPFLVISAGTRNHFAMDLGLDRDDPARCLEALTDGVELRIDLGFVNDQPFVNNASFGAYAAVVQHPAYRGDKARTTLKVLPDLLTHHTGPRLTVRTQDAVIERPQAVLVSNNPYRIGDAAGLGRRERLDSGALGVLGVTVDNAAQAAGMLRGRHGPGLTSLTAAEVVVDADTPTLHVGVDGEALTLPSPVRCRVAPGALRVRLPRHRPGTRGGKPRMDWGRIRRLALTGRRRHGRRS
ncbi:diacylglycerol kinase [Streptomyces sp. LX-29]|uniref:diacylglycerol/lipid kinase family protein n=1 Tax=Streptomyces sp. LX-29 TaxID=2900152 RepID=UPI00240DFBF8|nr:diacylglycerol kinase family protein [Streptomyces sp. LX-29]WFB10612.1 diacylglycerol kinase [Streptomyces sp. LX-29]